MLSVLSRGGGRRRRGEGEGPTVRLPRHDMPIGSATHLHSPVFPLGGVVEAAVEVAGVTLGPVLVVRVGHDARTPCVVRSRSRPRAVRSRSRSWSRWRRMHAGLRCDPRGGVEGEAPSSSVAASVILFSPPPSLVPLTCWPADAATTTAASASSPTTAGTTAGTTARTTATGSSTSASTPSTPTTTASDRAAMRAAIATPAAPRPAISIALRARRAALAVLRLGLAHRAVEPGVGGGDGVPVAGELRSLERLLRLLPLHPPAAALHPLRALLPVLLLLDRGGAHFPIGAGLRRARRRWRLLRPSRRSAAHRGAGPRRLLLRGLRLRRHRCNSSRRRRRDARVPPVGGGLLRGGRRGRARRGTQLPRRRSWSRSRHRGRSRSPGLVRSRRRNRRRCRSRDRPRWSRSPSPWARVCSSSSRRGRGGAFPQGGAHSLLQHQLLRRQQLLLRRHLRRIGSGAVGLRPPAAGGRRSRAAPPQVPLHTS